MQNTIIKIIRLIFLLIIVILAYGIFFVMTGIRSLLSDDSFYFAVNYGVYQFRLAESLATVLAFIIATWIILSYIISYDKLVKRYFQFHVPILISENLNRPLDLEKLKAIIDRDLDPQNNSKLCIFFQEIIDALLPIVILLIIALALDVLVNFSMLRADIFTVVVFMFWLLLYVGLYILDISEYLFGFSFHTGLYISLVLLYISSLIVTNVDMTNLYQLYVPFESYYLNSAIQDELGRLAYKYADLLMQWSLIQGVVFCYLDRKMPKKEKSRKVKEFEIQFEKGLKESYDEVEVMIKKGQIMSACPIESYPNKLTHRLHNLDIWWVRVCFLALSSCVAIIFQIGISNYFTVGDVVVFSAVQIVAFLTLLCLFKYKKVMRGKIFFLLRWIISFAYGLWILAMLIFLFESIDIFGLLEFFVFLYHIFGSFAACIVAIFLLKSEKNKLI